MSNIKLNNSEKLHTANDYEHDNDLEQHLDKNTAKNGLIRKTNEYKRYLSQTIDDISPESNVIHPISIKDRIKLLTSTGIDFATRYGQKFTINKDKHPLEHHPTNGNGKIIHTIPKIRKSIEILENHFEREIHHSHDDLNDPSSEINSRGDNNNICPSSIHVQNIESVGEYSADDQFECLEQGIKSKNLQIDYPEDEYNPNLYETEQPKHVQSIKEQLNSLSEYNCSDKSQEEIGEMADNPNLYEAEQPKHVQSIKEQLNSLSEYNCSDKSQEEIGEKAYNPLEYDIEDIEEDYHLEEELIDLKLNDTSGENNFENQWLDDQVGSITEEDYLEEQLIEHQLEHIHQENDSGKQLSTYLEEYSSIENMDYQFDSTEDIQPETANEEHYL